MTVDGHDRGPVGGGVRRQLRSATRRRQKQGGTVYAETVGESGSLKSLKLPDAWNVQVLAYVDGKVYYRADTDDTGAWKLYSWVPGQREADPDQDGHVADGRVGRRPRSRPRST